ncbi:hypothetical protein BCR35DRAFT_307869 [Leucosporidium creatinivorum]|uniref:Uncharacterized protein n=1 Tax=Leucosporidium creatinivorum TaxID=106004 RepID=A0A1Y2EJ12_9BASI|nr:hypothetical protein BCR35DRAFT_307869 [Leucosporidium creatinivorum]
MSSTAGPPPDLTARYALKAKYARLQRSYQRALEMSKDLKLEVGEKETTVQRLQDEVDLIIDQIYDSDYAHLRPEQDDLFSDEEGDAPSSGGAAAEEGGEQQARESNGLAELNGKVRKDHPPQDSPPQAKRARLDEPAAAPNGTASPASALNGTVA